MLVTHGFRPRRSLRDQAAERFKTGALCSALAPLEPRRRRSLPEEAFCEGALPTDSRMPRRDCAFATERRPVLLLAAGPARADEGGAADAVADWTPKRSRQLRIWRYVELG